MPRSYGPEPKPCGIESETCACWCVLLRALVLVHARARKKTRNVAAFTRIPVVRVGRRKPSAHRRVAPQASSAREVEVDLG